MNFGLCLRLLLPCCNRRIDPLAQPEEKRRPARIMAEGDPPMQAALQQTHHKRPPIKRFTQLQRALILQRLMKHNQPQRFPRRPVRRRLNGKRIARRHHTIAVRHKKWIDRMAGQL